MKVEGRPRLSYPSAVSPRPKLPDIFLSPFLAQGLGKEGGARLPAAMSDGPEMAFLGGGRGLAYFTLKRLGHILAFWNFQWKARERVVCFVSGRGLAYFTLKG